MIKVDLPTPSARPDGSARKGGPGRRGGSAQPELGARRAPDAALSRARTHRRRRGGPGHPFALCASWVQEEEGGLSWWAELLRAGRAGRRRDGGNGGSGGGGGDLRGRTRRGHRERGLGERRGAGDLFGGEAGEEGRASAARRGAGRVGCWCCCWSGVDPSVAAARPFCPGRSVDEIQHPTATPNACQPCTPLWTTPRDLLRALPPARTPPSSLSLHGRGDERPGGRHGRHVQRRRARPARRRVRA